MEGFSILFKATYQKPTHSGNLPSPWASKKKDHAYMLSQMKSIHYSLRCALWGSLTSNHEEEGEGPSCHFH